MSLVYIVAQVPQFKFFLTIMFLAWSPTLPTLHPPFWRNHIVKTLQNEIQIPSWADQACPHPVEKHSYFTQGEEREPNALQME